MKTIALFIGAISAKTWMGTGNSTDIGWTVMYNETSARFMWNATVKDGVDFTIFEGNGANNSDAIRLFGNGTVGVIEDVFGNKDKATKDTTQSFVNLFTAKPAAAGGMWTFRWEQPAKAGADSQDADVPCDGKSYTWAWNNKNTKEMGNWTWQADAKCVVTEDKPATTGSVATTAATSLVLGAMLATLF